MSNNALFTIEQVDSKLLITVELVKPETVETDLPETRPMNADEIAYWVYNNAGISILHKETLARYIKDLVQYELNKAKR